LKNLYRLYAVTTSSPKSYRDFCSELTDKDTWAYQVGKVDPAKQIDMILQRHKMKTAYDLGIKNALELAKIIVTKGKSDFRFRKPKTIKCHSPKP